jgi:DNA-binding transcriptional LysR family regulator
MLYSPSHWFLRHRLKLRSLALLVAMDDHSSLQRAADALSMTQPAASKMLAELEALWGLPLFHRFPRGVEATACGAMVIRHARHVLSELNQVGDEIANLRGQADSQIAIGSIKAPALSMVPRAIVEFQSQYAHASINLTVDSSPALMAKLQRDELDIVVGRMASGAQAPHFHYEELVQAQAVQVVARRAHPWQRRQTVSWSELTQASWIVPPQGSLLRVKFDALFVQHKVLPPLKLVETQDLDTLRRLLAQTDMLAVLTDEVAQACDGQSVDCLNALLPMQMQGFGLITRKGRTLSNAVLAMKDILRKVGRSQYV